MARRSGAFVLKVILADAELELVPELIAGHPSIRTMAKAMGKSGTRMILDANAHQAAIKQLDQGGRRGRPDITHYTLLALLESPLNQAGGLSVCIHTRHGQLIHIKPETRLPRGEARFQGVMARVLSDGRSQDKDPLIWNVGVRSPGEVLAAFASGPVTRFDPSGETSTFEAYAQGAEEDSTVIIGGFPNGTFSDDWQRVAPESLSLWPKALSAWAVAAELVAIWRTQKGPSLSDSTAPS
jgi:rRNA small subunit pseudouridine methyltransferase Nep1